MEAILACIALAIAIWQLKLQRDEIRRNAQINSLMHIAGMLKDKIDHHERIIADMKVRREEWKWHAAKVNGELRPMLMKTHALLMSQIGHQIPQLDMPAIRESLKLEETG